MKSLICFFGIVTIFLGTAHGQSILLQGRVVEERSGQPLPGAIVTMISLPDSVVLERTATSASGAFDFLVAADHQVIVRASYVGFLSVLSPPVTVKRTKLIRLDDLQLTEDAVLLNAVTVAGKKPAIRQEVDRMTVDVAGTVLAEGNNVLELLERTPGISTEGEGNFAVNGRSGARVTLDGRTTYLSGAQLALLLKGMQARDISKVEIMSSPSARQDAEGSGGVINIVTKKNRNSAGWGGDIFARASYGRRPQYAVGSSVTYEAKGLKASLSGSHGYDESRTNGFSERVYVDESRAVEDTLLVTRQWEKNRTDPSRNYALRADLEYTPDTVRTTGFSLHWIKGRYQSYADAEMGFYEGTTNRSFRQAETNNLFDEGYNNLTYTLYHIRRLKGEGHQLRLTADYAPHGNTYTNGFYTRFLDASGSVLANVTARSNTQDLANTTYVGSLDYLRSMKGGGKIEAGWKATYLAIDNRVVNDTLRGERWVRDEGTTNAFRYGQHLQAGYLIFKTKVRKFDVQAGVRGEYTATTAYQMTLNSKIRRHYFDLFPNLYLSYPVNDKHTTRFSYARRIARPGDHDVNVFRAYEDPFNYWEGNPYLRPSKTHATEVGYAYDNRFFASFLSSIGSDVIMSIGRSGERVGEVLSRPENVGRFVNYGLSLMYNVSPTEWLDASNYLHVFHNRYHGQFGEVVLDNSANSWSFNTRFTTRLTDKWSAEGVAYYRSGTASGMNLTAPGYGVDFSINKTFLEKKLTLKVAGTGILRNRRPVSSSAYGNLRSTSYVFPDNRKVMVSLSYRIN